MSGIFLFSALLLAEAKDSLGTMDALLVFLLLSSCCFSLYRRSWWTCLDLCGFLFLEGVTNTTLVCFMTAKFVLASLFVGYSLFREGTERVLYYRGLHKSQDTAVSQVHKFL